MSTTADPPPGVSEEDWRTVREEQPGVGVEDLTAAAYREYAALIRRRQLLMEYKDFTADVQLQPRQPPRGVAEERIAG